MIDYDSRPFERVVVVAMVVVAMVVVVFYVGFIGFKMGANGGRAQMGVDTISVCKNLDDSWHRGIAHTSIDYLYE